MEFKINQAPPTQEAINEEVDRLKEELASIKSGLSFRLTKVAIGFLASMIFCLFLMHAQQVIIIGNFFMLILRIMLPIMLILCIMLPTNPFNFEYKIHNGLAKLDVINNEQLLAVAQMQSRATVSEYCKRVGMQQRQLTQAEFKMLQQFYDREDDLNSVEDAKSHVYGESAKS